MIYLKNIKTTQLVMIPRTVRVFESTGWALELNNNTTGKRAVFSALTDVTGRNTYVGLNVEFSEREIPTGEYFYTLSNGGATVAQGIAVVGDYKPERVQYEDDHEIVQYNG